MDWSKIFQLTPQDIVKLLVTALIILFVNKIQLVNDKLSALLIALPITSLIAMVWMHHGKQGGERIANHAQGTFWFVLPTLPMFLIMPAMMRRGWGFYPSLGVNCLITIGLFWLTVVILRRCGYDLMG